jgi:hypothetical protein
MGAVAVRGFTLTSQYVELPGSTIGMDHGKLIGTRIFRVLDYANVPAFLQALGGGFESTGTITTYSVPHQYSTNFLVWCVRATCEGIGVPQRVNGETSFQGGSKVTAYYESLSYDPRQRSNNQTPAPYITESRSIGGQMVTLTGTINPFTGKAVWSFNDPTAGWLQLLNDGPSLAFVQAEGEYRLQLHYRPSFSASTVNGLIGKVNNATFPGTSEMGGGATGTLLFLGDDTERSITADGVTLSYETTLKFAYKPIGWNNIISPYDGSAAAVGLTESHSTPPYTSADFSPLIS